MLLIEFDIINQKSMLHFSFSFLFRDISCIPNVIFEDGEYYFLFKDKK